jgi:hypothetical protein
MARRLPLVAALAGLIGIAAALVVVLAQERVPVTGGNNEFTGSPQFGIVPGQDACQPDETVPAGTAVVRLRAAAQGAPGALRLQVRAGDRVLASGLQRWDGAMRDLDFALDPEVRRPAVAEICLRNVGTAMTAIWSFARTTGSAYKAEGPFGYRFRTQYLGRAPESRLGGAETTVRRMATARGSLLDGWAPWGALVSMLALVAVVLAAARGLAR